MQKKTRFKRIWSLFACLVLITAMALTVTGCQNTSETGETASSENTTSLEEKQAVSFTFVVVDENKKEQTFTINTTEKTVGDALLKEGLIEGEEGEYGLYVKTVNGKTLDFNKDGAYWAFYCGDEYAASGAETTEIIDGGIYMFKASRG